MLKTGTPVLSKLWQAFPKVLQEDMARAIELIERDMKALLTRTRAIALELKSAYTNYLTDLGQVVRSSAVLASYNLCTQGYPELFLSLSFSQRQQLQQDIRQAAQQAQRQLLSHISEENSQLEQSTTPEGDGNDIGSSNQMRSPEELAKWQRKLEQAIAHTLRTTSQQINRLLHQAGILPKKLPEKLLEAGFKGEATGEALGTPPNILNLLVEADNQENAEPPAMTRIVAIQLRLSDIEFADPTVRSGRNHIRDLLAKLNKLGREYQKKGRELAIAQAEAAWRTSWFDD